MKLLTCTAVASFLFLALPVRAETLSLREALEKASARNLALEAARRQLKVSEGQVLEAKAIPNPEVDVSINKLRTKNPQLSDSAKDYTLQQTVEIWGKRKLRTKAARSELAANEAQYEALTLDVMKRVKEAYWDLSLAHDEVNFAEENLKFQQRFLGRVQDRFQFNQATMADLTRAKVEQARAVSDLLEAKKKLETAQSQLNRLMGDDVKTELPAPEPLTETHVDLKEEELVRRAQEARPERSALDRLTEGGKAELSLARRLLWAPDLKAQVLYQQGERNDNLDSWGGGLGLVFPLWYHYKGERVAAAGKVASLEAQGEDLDQQIALEVHQAILELRLDEEQLKVWKKTVDQATESARLAEQRYLEGDVDLLVFFEARRALVATTLQYYDSLKNYWVDWAALERAVGGDLVTEGGKPS